MSEKIGSERTYFSFRYTLPGFTFLTLILLINSDFLILQIIQYPDSNTLFGIILGFLTLLSGSAIGFIISQPWYIFTNFFLKSHGIIMGRESYRILNKIYNLEEISDPFTVMTCFLTSKIPERMTKYFNRRNDMFHSLGSTLSAIIGGLYLGYYLRALTTQQTFFSKYDFLIISFSLIFIFIIIFNLWKVLEENDSMATLMLEFYSDEFMRLMRRPRGE